MISNMKTLGFCCLLVGLTALGMFAIASNDANGDAKMVVARLTNHYQGTNYIAEVSLLELKKAPPWNGNDKPPLSVAKAETLGSKYLESRLGRPDSSVFPPPIDQQNARPPWIVAGTVIRRFYDSEFWFYELEIQPLIHSSYNWPAIKVFVTMDGKCPPFRVSK